MFEKDWLTGLYIKAEMEQRVTELLKNKESGILLLLDLSEFKKINDTYGHITGDRLLQKVAGVFREEAQGRGLAGRIGPDTFALFLCEVNEHTTAIKEHMTYQLAGIGTDLGVKEEVKFTAVATYGDSEEEGSKIFKRGDILLLTEKRSRRRPSAKEPDAGESRTTLCRDMEIITSELAEPGDIRGAYLQDYVTFKKIYQFVTRGLERSKDSAYLLLLTLGDEESGNPVMPEDREELMELLFQVIKSELRRGDAFTQYGSCQYLLMVLGTSGENAVKIGERVRNSFNKVVSYQYELTFSIDSYPLKSKKQNF